VDAPSGPGAPLKVRFGGLPGASTDVPILVAERQGFLAEQGISLDKIQLTQSNAVASALSSGQVDLVPSTVQSMAVTRAKGADVVGISAIYPQSTLELVAKDPAVPVVGVNGATWQDTIRSLDGAAIGGGAKGGTADLQLGYLFEQAGLRPDAFSIINAGKGATEIAALQSGQVRANLSTSLVAELGRATGQSRTVMSMSRGAPAAIADQAYMGWWSTGRFLEAHPDFTKRFRAAMDKALQFMREPANLDVVVASATDYKVVSQIDAAQARDVLTAEVQQYGLTFAPGQMQATIDFVGRLGLFDGAQAVRAEDLVVPAAVASP
jgi:ABC-type nitrate/sulfonate/bicarbonate transport system substrate-binding protein